MELSSLSQEQKLKLYEHITSKYSWAKNKENIRRLALLEIKTGKIVL